MSNEQIIEDLKSILHQVTDPEIPVLTIQDLGILRDVEILDDVVKVTITPTYSGCPAMDMIEGEILKTLLANGYENVVVDHSLSPAWTSDWLSEQGKLKLEEYGIAPPAESTSQKNLLSGQSPAVRCPQCKSTDTYMQSLFGSTACKALYRCRNCAEPFDYFKCF